MYKVVPYFGDNLVETLPNCMYNVRSYHGETSTILLNQKEDTNPKENHDSVENDQETITQVVQRQECIINELKGLENELKQIRINLDQLMGKNQSVQNVENIQIKTSEKGPKIEFPSDEIVIFSHPNHAPNSLISIKKLLLENGVKVVFKVHLHSSIKSPLPENCQDLIKTLELNQDTSQKENQVVIRLILAELMENYIGSPHQILVKLNGGKSQFCGEANLLRYLARIFPQPIIFPYDKNVEIEVDNLLDVSYKMQACKTGNDASKMLNILIKALNTNQKDQGNRLINQINWSIADIALYWAIQKLPTTKETNNKALKDWLIYCKQYF